MERSGGGGTLILGVALVGLAVVVALPVLFVVEQVRAQQRLRLVGEAADDAPLYVQHEQGRVLGVDPVAGHRRHCRHWD